MHCDEPECVAVCTTGASYQTDSGVVLVDYDVCLGCEECVLACPYHARLINTNDSNFFDAAEPAPYEEFGVQRINVAEKCTFCDELTAEGILPMCVTNCPGKARFFGDLDDPESEVAVRAKDAIEIGSSGVFYKTPASMPGSMLAEAVMAPRPNAPEPGGSAGGGESGGSVVPIVVGAAVVAAGVGAGVAINMNKKKKAASGEEG